MKDPTFRLAPVYHGGSLAGQVDPFAAGLEEVGNVRTVFHAGGLDLTRPEEYVLEDRGSRDGLVWRFLRELDVELGLVPPPPPGPPPGVVEWGDPGPPIGRATVEGTVVTIRPLDPQPEEMGPPTAPRLPDLPRGDGPREGNSRSRGGDDESPPPPPPFPPPPQGPPPPP